MKQNDHFIQESKRIINRNQTPGQFYVLYVDITAFHTVNNVYGNESGDMLLDRMEDFLYRCPGVCLCARVFADLFLCLSFLEEGTDVESIMVNTDERIEHFLSGQRAMYPACKLKAACGICLVKNSDIVEAVEGANVARKRSKNQMTIKSVLYDQDLQNQTAAMHETEREIYRALVEGKFCFHLQPKVELTTGEIIGAEALARRMNDKGEIIYPDTFLESMESSGYIVELDRIILRQVCAYLAERMEEGRPVVCTSVNLSRLHIHNTDTAEDLHGIVQEYHIPPKYLEFELTETILLEEFAGAKRLTDQLRAYGYRVSIDDFGSGYAGINIWQELNFDCLKLDRKFLSESHTLKKRNEAIVPNIINIAQRLHIEVLCEGVETVEQCLYLLQLGCTTVQGFFFSKPLLPKQFYNIYEEQGEKYPLPAQLQHLADIKKTTQEDKDVIRHLKRHRKLRHYLPVILLCALFLGVCITGILTVSRNLTQQEFKRMVKETLNAYTEGQRENTLTEIEGVENTLKSLAVLIESNPDPDFIEGCLLALNEESSEIQYMYFSDEDYRKTLEDGSVRPKDTDTVNRLKNGETVVTDITYSKRLGGIYCIGIGVPVIRDETFEGALRGVIEAEALVSTELYNPSQGEVSAVFLTDGESKILPIRDENGRGVGDYLLERLQEKGVIRETIEELRDAYRSQNGETYSIRIGDFEGYPYYLSLADLKYNGWHLVVCLKADKAYEHFQYIMRNTSSSIVGLIFAVMLVSAVLLLFIRRMQKRFTMEEQRYLLLERFSDTVLFDYDYRHDTIRFTSNAPKFLRIHDLSQKRFTRHLDQIYVYAADQRDVHEMLEGKKEGDRGEIRVRLMRPDSDDYFWCLVQYEYLYERGILVSVIGKITDIDEHMKHEDYLLRMSETDGLTGLLNKAAAEKQIAHCVGQAKKGTMFLIDIDNFKHINDQYGHAAGDMALRYLGECMKKTFRECDILGRIGGDELLVFAENLEGQDKALKRAELLENNLEACTEPGVPPCTVSIGIASFPADGKTYSDLFKAADQAMYAAKQKGKRQYALYRKIP